LPSSDEEDYILRKEKKGREEENPDLHPRLSLFIF